MSLTFNIGIELLGSVNALKVKWWLHQIYIYNNMWLS